MKKSIAKSTTTRTMAAAGLTGSAGMSVLVGLQQAFPEAAILQNPAVMTGAVFVMNVIIIPAISRLFARILGK